MSAPLLAQVRGHVFVDAAVVAVSFPSLLSAYSLAFGNVRTSVQSIDLPALTTLSGGGGPAAGTFRLPRPRNLVSLSLPSLESTSGSFSITEGNLLASIDLPSLTSVGPSFTVSDNPVLPTCQAQAVLDQLVANGWTGTVDISGNDDSGTCP